MREFTCRSQDALYRMHSNYENRNVLHESIPGTKIRAMLPHRLDIPHCSKANVAENYELKFIFSPPLVLQILYTMHVRLSSSTQTDLSISQCMYALVFNVENVAVRDNLVLRTGGFGRELAPGKPQ